MAKKKTRSKKMNKSKVGNISKSLGLSPKQLKTGLGVFFGIVILLLVLARVPATSNWPVVSWVKSFFSSAMGTVEWTMINKHNNERAKYNIPALTASETLTTCSREHSSRMYKNDGVYHDSAQSLSNCAYKVCNNNKATIVGENVGVGKNADEVFKMWLDSPKHRANIMDTSYEYIGAGLYEDSDGIDWWTARFVRCSPVNSGSGGGSCIVTVAPDNTLPDTNFSIGLPLKFVNC